MNNNCKHLKIKINYTLECKKQNKQISIKECNGYKFRANKDTQFSLKKRAKSSKRTQALSIPKEIN